MIKKVELILLLILTKSVVPDLIKVSPKIPMQRWEKNIGVCTGVKNSEWRFEGTSWNTFKPYKDTTQQNCTLKTGAWKTAPAHRVLIQVVTITSKCNETLLQLGLCRNNLTLTVYKDEKVTENFHIPNTEIKQPFFTFTDSIYIEDMQHYNELRLEFRAERYGGQIHQVEISYLACPIATENLVDFKSSPAPSKNDGVRTIKGECTKNSKFRNDTAQPTLECAYDGTYKVNGQCVCDAGYEKKDKECQACINGKYKPIDGNEIKCRNCGRNTKLGTVPKLKCDCRDNFYKFLTQRNTMDADCYQPPGPPKKFKATIIKSKEVTLSWDHSFPGSSDLGTYYLTCDDCPPNRKEFPVTTNKTSIIVQGLGSYAEYTIFIVNYNKITNLTGESYRNRTTFTTLEGEPGLIQDLKFETNPDGDTVVTWNPPFARGGKNLKYYISYGEKVVVKKETTILIYAGTSKKEYTFKIHAEVAVSGRTFSGGISSIDITVNGGIALPVSLGIAFGGIIFFVLVLVIAFCIWRKRNPAYLQVVRMEDGTVKVPTRFYNNGKIYIDPKTYSLVDDAVNDFAFEIDRKDLMTGDVIGEGEFADVYKGQLFKDGKKKEVAVKKLKKGANKKDRDDFLSEAAILGQFSDPNVVMLEGVILSDEPNAIILEFMAHGALDMYLQENDMQLSIYQLLEMARGIASGMKYLSEMGFVHRDLAARNILVNEQKVCKVADFGMSLELNVDESVETKGGKIPVRWTAPEAIQYKKFTTASDVWSFGVVLWEIMSYGERPYWDWSNYEVVEQVTNGYRLPPPMGCPRVVHDLMLLCWSKERPKRPLFSTIRDKIEAWMRNPHLLDDLAPVMKLDENLDYTIMQTINKWLEAIGMGRYAINFIEQGFATPRQILLLTIDDLELLGIGSLDHRKKIYKAISNTRSQVETQLQRTGSVQSNRRTGSINSMGPKDIAPKLI